MTTPKSIDAAQVRSALDPDIAGLNLEPVAYNVALSESWDLLKIDAVELEYRCWLQCVRDFPHLTIVPSRDCDRYWHAHVLTLELYLQQMHELFGRPLFHWPFAGTLGAADAAQQRARYQESRCIVSELLERVRRTRLTNKPVEGV